MYYLAKKDWMPIFIAYFWVNAWIFFFPLYGASYPFWGCVSLVFCGVLLLLSHTNEDGLLFFLNKKAAIVAACATSLSISSWVATPLYQTLNSKIHAVPCLTNLVCLLLQLMGADVACNTGKGVINTNENVIAFSASLELMDIYWILLFCIALSIIFLSTAKWQWRKWVIALLVILFYGLIRVSVLLVLYSNFPDYNQMKFPLRSAIFFDPFWRAVSFFPIVFVLPIIVADKLPLKRQENAAAGNIPIQWQRILSVGSVFLLTGFFYTGTYILEDPGQKKTGQILIDDWHSGQWEPADIQLGEQDFGGTPLYAYSELVRLLRSCFTTVDINTNTALNSDQLGNYDVLILKTPVKPYSNQEIIAIQNFTKKGGGLLLVADHSDLLGMNTYFNELIPEWSARYNFDSVNRLSDGWFYEYVPDRIFRHVIMRGINKFEFLTSCSITCPFIGSEIVIPASDAISDPVDYSQRNFFSTMRLTPEHSFGCLTLCAASQVEQGRVLMFTDGTIFSSFCFYRGGHTKFALNSVDWLNRKNSWGYLPNYVLGVLMLTTACWGIIVFLRSPHVLLLTSGLIALVCGCIIGGSVFYSINAITYKEIVPQQKQNPRIGFVTKGTFFRLPPVIGMEDPDQSTSFNSFWLSSIRIGAEPKIIEDIYQILKHPTDVLVFVNPSTNLSKRDLDIVKKYVSEGGSLLVIDGIRNNSNGANSLLSEFGLEINFTSMDITGGEKLNFESEKTVFKAAMHKVGKGKVFVAVDSMTISDHSLGNAMAVPTDEQKKIYEIVFSLYKRCMGIDVQ